MKCTVKWVDGVKFMAQTGSGHAFVMEGAPEQGGLNHAPRPMEMLLAGAGGCAAYDVVMILQRGRHGVEGCEVTLEAERAANDPKVFTKIHYHFTVRGKQLKSEAVERAIQLSAEKYCSASIMLGKTATISHDFETIESA